MNWWVPASFWRTHSGACKGTRPISQLTPTSQLTLAVPAVYATNSGVQGRVPARNLIIGGPNNRRFNDMVCNLLFSSDYLFVRPRVRASIGSEMQQHQKQESLPNTGEDAVENLDLLVGDSEVTSNLNITLF